MPSSVPEDPLISEQHHLDSSRAALRRMHDHTASLAFTGENKAMAGDHVSTQYLLQTLYRRMKSLQDDPEVPLFFGKLHYDPSVGAERDEIHYIGRRHIVGETGGEPLVIDWRAPMSLPFYRARPGVPMQVRLRRRFGFSHGRLTAYEDEDLTTSTATVSAILESEIERPRTGPMRDIVATIQPEQDLIVRVDLAESICVQGAPGTGKTAVGLHRAAYLLYAFREQLRRSGVLVIGPNDNFLSYIGDVLPALGEIDAAAETIESLVSFATGVHVTGTDTPDCAVLKGDPRMAAVLEAAVWSHIGEPSEALVVPRGSRSWRVPPHLAQRVVAELRSRGVRYEAGREMLPQRLAHLVLVRMEAAGDSPDDRVQNAVARSAPVKAYAKQLWPALDPAKLLLRLYSDRDFLSRCAGETLTEQEQDLLIMAKPARSAKAMRWSLADVVLLDEILDLRHRTTSMGHVIVDEAQDLSAMQLRAIGRRASTGSITVLGDLAQATTPWATSSWQESLTHLGKPQAHIEELTAGFRVPGAVIDYAAQLLPHIAPQLAPPHSVRRSRGDLTQIRGGADTWARWVSAALGNEGTVGVIVPDPLLAEVGAELSKAGIDFQSVVDERNQEFTSRVDLVPAALAKGLEFDHVVLIEPSAIVSAEPDRRTGLRRLYVCLTRAVTTLVIISHQELPTELPTPGPDL